MTSCPHCRLSPIVYAYLVEHVDNMAFYGMRAYGEEAGYLGIGESLCYQAENLNLPAGESGFGFPPITIWKSFLLYYFG